MITTTGHRRKAQEKFMTESKKKRKKGKKKKEKYKEKREVFLKNCLLLKLIIM